MSSVRNYTVNSYENERKDIQFIESKLLAASLEDTGSGKENDIVNTILN